VPDQSRLRRFRWWLGDLRWRLADLRDSDDAKVSVGLLVLVMLVFGGFFAARTVARASSATSTGAHLRAVTLRQRIRVREHGRVVTRWRLRRVYEQAQTVLQTQTVRTPNGIRLVTRPVTRYRLVYRKRLVRVNGKARTVLRPVTDTQTRTNTQLLTVTRQVTNNQVVTVTQPVTTTVVSTETDTVPVTVTVTVTLPGTTGP
jgi:hypothetical protein